jgi:MlaA lipoprotein
MPPPAPGGPVQQGGKNQPSVNVIAWDHVLLSLSAVIRRRSTRRTLLWMMFMGMAVGMTACSGVRSGAASSFKASFDGHRSGMMAVSAGSDPTARPSQQMNADAALEGRLPGSDRLASANAVSAADVPMPILPLNDEEVLEEYDPWEPFNRKMFAFNRQLDRFVLKPPLHNKPSFQRTFYESAESAQKDCTVMSLPQLMIYHVKFSRSLRSAARRFACTIGNNSEARV